MALDLAGRVDIESPPVDGNAAAPSSSASGQLLTAIAIYDGRQWASLCPDFDIASVGANADEAITNLITAVSEAVGFAREQNLEPGRPVSPDELRAFLISSQAPYLARNFSV